MDLFINFISDIICYFKGHDLVRQDEVISQNGNTLILWYCKRCGRHYFN